MSTSNTQLSGCKTTRQHPEKYHPDLSLQVFCDMETEGGGWTVIQRRADIEPREDFFRTWTEYALGFGNLKGEFWLGNDNIHALTDQTLNEVRFDLVDFNNNTRWANYKFFYVHDRKSLYKLEAHGYSGDAGDSLTEHSGYKFSTKDSDNDIQYTPIAVQLCSKGPGGIRRVMHQTLMGCIFLETILPMPMELTGLRGLVITTPLRTQK
ncbi:LOW QUALITY PROTEIN: ficolin-2-like [Palaemon carinicauda]|uniref:LOW QUALITY PROTEIN: ficolin-2-like n=1 Tax=Palaemon carinicauda TaxID=392227 RepID=UPI0035B5D9C1